jgi:hypothetical protein
MVWRQCGWMQCVKAASFSWAIKAPALVTASTLIGGIGISLIVKASNLTLGSGGSLKGEGALEGEPLSRWRGMTKSRRDSEFKL